MLPFLKAIKHVLVDESVARGERNALYWTKGDGAAFWTAWAEEENSMTKEKIT